MISECVWFASALLNKAATYEQKQQEELDLPASIKDCGTPAGLAKLEKLKGYLEAYR